MKSTSLPSWASGVELNNLYQNDFWKYEARGDADVELGRGGKNPRMRGFAGARARPTLAPNSRTYVRT